MGRNRNRKPSRRGGYYSEVYWGQLDYNRRLENAYLDQIINLAVTRFEWRGLPDTVDPIFLEKVLLMRGVATIAQPLKGTKRGFWYSARMTQDGDLGIYDRPTKWIAYSRDKLRFHVEQGKNGVLVYDNAARTPLFDSLLLCARELVDIQKTKQVNRFWQKVPYILVAPQDMELGAENLLLQIMSGEPATVANPMIREIDAYKLDMNVPYLGAELTAAEQNVWNRVYTLLGISNITFKSERMIEDEVRSMSEPAGMMALSGLVERRRSAEVLSRLFGMDVSVIWRHDNESENANLMSNVQSMANLLAGDTKGLAEVMGNDGPSVS